MQMFTDTPKKSIKISRHELKLLQDLYKKSEFIEGKRLINKDDNPMFSPDSKKLMHKNLLALWHIIDEDNMFEMFWYLDPYNLLDL